MSALRGPKNLRKVAKRIRAPFEVFDTNITAYRAGVLDEFDLPAVRTFPEATRADIWLRRLSSMLVLDRSCFVVDQALDVMTLLILAELPEVLLAQANELVLSDQLEAGQLMDTRHADALGSDACSLRRRLWLGSDEVFDET